jgi:hypothetical protein
MLYYHSLEGILDIPFCVFIEWVGVYIIRLQNFGLYAKYHMKLSAFSWILFRDKVLLLPHFHYDNGNASLFGIFWWSSSSIFIELVFC